MSKARSTEEILNRLEPVLPKIRFPCTIADADATDTPLVWANTLFVELTGYDLREATGRNCRFLQADKPCETARLDVREAIATRSSATVFLPNHRRDGSPFINLLMLVPIAPNLPLIIGSQLDVTRLVTVDAKSRYGYRMNLDSADVSGVHRLREGAVRRWTTLLRSHLI